MRVLVIAGTFAPQKSKWYYKKILQLAQRYDSQVEFETISYLGLGNMTDAANRIAKKYLSTKEVWVIIGHSQGGILANLIAMKNPNVIAVIALASPFAGTTWTDPINMPIRAVVEAVSVATFGKLKLKPSLKRIIAPIPIVGDLSAHSDVSEYVLQYLATQTSGHITYSIIGSYDMLVFPHRSAHPEGCFVQNYLVMPRVLFERLQSRLPIGIENIDSSVGHITITHNSSVIAKIDEILNAHHKNLNSSAKHA